MNRSNYLLKTWILTLCFGVLITVNFGCKKGKADIEMTGVITDKTFASGLSGASIYLYEISADGSDITLIGETSTSSDGNYSLSFPRNQVLKYTLLVEKENYFSIEEDISFSDLSIEHVNIHNYATTAMSWARLRFVTSSGSTAQYNRQEGKVDCEMCCPAGVNTITGPIDTSIYCINDGNTTYSYQYLIQGTSNSGVKSATTAAFDTTEILLQW